jgi:hypothetical protein
VNGSGATLLINLYLRVQPLPVPLSTHRPSFSGVGCFIISVRPRTAKLILLSPPPVLKNTPAACQWAGAAQER